tara:strand:- start:15387 stop:15641 length:255 start_codon:yes stop_codon:yes gene_type:complete
MKLLLEKWRKIINEEVVDFPSEITAVERYANYIEYINLAIEQIISLEEIFERQGSTTEDLVEIKENLIQLRDDETLKYDMEGYE